MRSILIILFFMLVAVSAKSQRWQPGYFYDVKGNKETGLIRTRTNGKSPVKDEAYIEFKENPKAEPIKLSASDLRSFVVAQDSFVVAVAPATGAWSSNELDFVKVVVDEDADLKLYMFKGSSSGDGGIHSDLGIGVGGGFGGGGGGFGGGIGGGISIPIGGGHSRAVYYYGRNTAGMKELTPANFVDIMSDILGDQPEIVDQLHAGKYNLGNMDKLIANFYKLQDAPPPANSN